MHIHGLAPGLNYGQQAFEGLKAFRLPANPPDSNGDIALFRPDRNATRLQQTATALNMPHVPASTFIRACRAAVALNASHVPPHSTGCALYVRPILFASGPQFPPGEPTECTFCVYVVPTAEGVPRSLAAVKALVLDEFDRAAPRGTGHVKAGGNYAGVLRWSGKARSEGFGITLHLDCATREVVDEFSLCGFIGVLREPRRALRVPGGEAHADNANGRGAALTNTDEGGDDVITLVIPTSPSAIPSISSSSIQSLAKSHGWNVVHRAVPYTELPAFSEVLAAGTAVGLLSVESVTRRGTGVGGGDEVVQFEGGGVGGGDGGGGPVFKKLLRGFRGVQTGVDEDVFGWRFVVREEDGVVEGGWTSR